MNFSTKPFLFISQGECDFKLCFRTQSEQMNFKVITLFLHINERKRRMTSSLLLIIGLFLVSVFLHQRYKHKQISSSFFRQIEYTPVNCLEKLHSKLVRNHSISNEPRLLVSRQFFLRYLAEHKRIPGWTNFETFYVIWLFIQFQYKCLEKVDGAIGEIGVHRGKLTSYMYLMRHRSKRQKLFAVDTFAKKSLNIDSSGDGDRSEFFQNVKYYANVSANEIIVYEGSSLDLNSFLSNNSKAKQFWSQYLGPESCQLVSIDGGHTNFLTYSDLCLISRSLIDGGIVMVDDIDNAGWLGVRDGAAQFLAETSIVFDGKSDPELAAALTRKLVFPNFNFSRRIAQATKKLSDTAVKCSRLIPVLQYSNKLYLTTPNYYPHYIELLKKLNEGGTNFIRYDSLRSTAGNVPIWSDNEEKHQEIFENTVKPLWMADLAKATQ